ncbi:MAG: DUF342 domain-containing protein [Desulfobacteraceae bacterium]|nr:DUF342 domain-containing protein [Desulfobacteraceae bacterium]
MVTSKAKKESEKMGAELLELAVNCKLITGKQEKKILPEVFKLSSKDPKRSIAKLLYQKKILEKDQIEFLFSVKKHLDTLMLDKKFGKLGVANEFCRQECLDKALAIQIDIFKQKQRSVKVGDILLQKKEISEAHKTAILLTQDRIRDEFLVEAFNAIATNEMERSKINKRFGALAVKKELIDTDQLNQALQAQKKEVKEKGKKRYLGEILQDLFELSEKETLKILRIQKNLETKRMNLQKKVFAYNVEKESVKILDQFMEFQVSKDKLSAYIIKKEGDAPKIDSNDVINWLACAGIKYGLQKEKKIQKIIDSGEHGKRFKIAQGRIPVKAKQEQVKFAIEIKSTTDEDFSESGENFQVKKDDVIATITPSKEGTPGKDVFGHPIILKPDNTPLLRNGEGVVRIGNDFMAVLDGTLQVYKDRTLFVIPAVAGIETKEIDGDLSEVAKDEYLDCDLNVSGNITAGTKISCNKITVKGDALGDISATSDIEVQGSVGNIEDGEKSQPSVQITTHGELKVKGKKICANIVTDKGLTAPYANVVNSKIFSSGDIDVKNIQSDENTPSVIQIAIKHVVELGKLKATIKNEQLKLSKLICKSEIDDLNKNHMKQVQVQQDYLENQNVLAYLLKILDDSEFKDIKPFEKRIAAYEKKIKEANQNEKQETIPKNTKAHKFLEKVIAKLESVDQKDQNQYVKELYDNITGLFKSAVNTTDRFNKEYEVRVKQIDAHLEEHKDKILEKEQEIQKLLSREDYLNHISGKEEQLMINVKNEVAKYTRIKGNEAEVVIEESMHGVFIRENPATDKKAAEIIVQGSFE